MTFRGRDQFKKALIKYGLTTHRHLLFLKDESCRIRAKCSWMNCPWMIYASKNSRSDWFQVVTFNDVHICPERRDNRFVTARRIADRFESFMKAHPTWKVNSLKQTVLEEMFADVSVSKCKRAKAIVMERLLEATTGEYSKVFDYQLELMRSNPGITCSIILDS